jgi:hypothetical protein
MTMYCMLGANTQSEYVIIIIALPLQHGCKKAPQPYVRSLSVLFYMLLFKVISLQPVAASAKPCLG